MPQSGKASKHSGFVPQVVDGQGRAECIQDGQLEQLLAEERKTAGEIGGTPFLDGDYTVYGEVIEGMEVADAIANAARNGANRPNDDISMTVKIL